MKVSGLITLLTDFGLGDPYAGVMQGVILARFAGARIVDLCHGIAAQDIEAASFWTERTSPWFEPGTVHVVVVDPGVGSARQCALVEASGRLFVGPDNGVLWRVFSQDPRARAWTVDLGRLGFKVPSRTFHGRDVFAPLAAELAQGRIDPAEVGPALVPMALATPPWEVVDGPVVRGRVVLIDHFGNALTNIRAESLTGETSWHVECVSGRMHLVGTYAEAEVGAACALVGSFGVIELAVRDGSAAERLGLAPGQSVVARRRAPEPAAGSIAT